MSLLTSVTEESRGVSQYIESSYTSGGAAMISTGAASGIVRIQPASTGGSAGGSFLRGGPTATGLVLGANDTVNSAIVIATTPSPAVNVNVPLNMTLGNPLTVNSDLTVNGSSNFVSSISLGNQQVQNNLRYTQAFGPVADGTNDQPLGTAQPALIAGSYAISVQITSPSTGVQFQPSCIGYWNGTIWSAGANGAGITYPGGNVAVGIRPAVGGASLVMSNGSGSPVSGFIYYTSLGEN